MSKDDDWGTGPSSSNDETTGLTQRYKARTRAVLWMFLGFRFHPKP